MLDPNIVPDPDTMATADNDIGKINFSGMVTAKRRRMRSGGNVSTRSNNAATSDPLLLLDGDEDISKQTTTTTTKCKGASTIPIFLKST